MRISDWSSDVCSSDLLEARDEFPLAVADGAVSFMLPKDRLAARQRLAAKGGGHRTAFHWQDGMAIEGFGIGGTRQFATRRHDVDKMPRPAPERAASSDEGRVGQGWVRRVRYRWSPCTKT